MRLREAAEEEEEGEEEEAPGARRPEPCLQPTALALPARREEAILCVILAQVPGRHDGLSIYITLFRRVDFIFSNARFHAGHRANSTCNFAQNVELWDRLFGTDRAPNVQEGKPSKHWGAA